MTDAQRELLLEARDSVAAARLLVVSGFPGYAAARAYYAMFYVASAFLEGEGLSYSKHSAVIAAFGQHFARTGLLPLELHRHLIEAQALRQAGDYGQRHAVSTEQAREQISRAQAFLAIAETRIGSLPSAPTSQTERTTFDEP